MFIHLPLLLLALLICQTLLDGSESDKITLSRSSHKIGGSGGTQRDLENLEGSTDKQDVHWHVYVPGKYKRWFFQFAEALEIAFNNLRIPNFFTYQIQDLGKAKKEDMILVLAFPKPGDVSHLKSILGATGAGLVFYVAESMEHKDELRKGVIQKLNPKVSRLM